MKVLPLIAASALTAVGCFWSLTGPAQATPIAAFDLSKTTSNTNPNVGDLFDYFITITNTNAGTTAPGTSVTDTMPSGIILEDFVSTPAGTSTLVTGGNFLTWTIGDLAAGPGETLELEVLAMVPGLWTNTAFATSTDTNVNGANSSVNVTVGATPLPAALPLFATGIGALGLLGWRRRRKAAA
jgi:uncharacterized repeat protein (TIGR01451 family)